MGLSARGLQPLGIPQCSHPGFPQCEDQGVSGPGLGINPASLPWPTLRAGRCAELLGDPSGTVGEDGWSTSAWAQARGSPMGLRLPRGLSPAARGQAAWLHVGGPARLRPGPLPPSPSSGKASPPCPPIRRLAGKHPAPDTGGSGREETEASGNRRPLVGAGLAPQPVQEPFLFRSGLRPSREGAPGNPRLGAV